MLEQRAPDSWSRSLSRHRGLAERHLFGQYCSKCAKGPYLQEHREASHMEHRLLCWRASSPAHLDQSLEFAAQETSFRLDTSSSLLSDLTCFI